MTSPKNIMKTRALDTPLPKSNEIRWDIISNDVFNISPSRVMVEAMERNAVASVNHFESETWYDVDRS